MVLFKKQAIYTKRTPIKQEEPIKAKTIGIEANSFNIQQFRIVSEMRRQ